MVISSVIWMRIHKTHWWKRNIYHSQYHFKIFCISCNKFWFTSFRKTSCRPKRRKMPILQVCMLRFQNSYIIGGKRWQIQRMVMMAEPKPITFENNEPSNYVEEAEALALSPIPENEKCEFQRSEIEETWSHFLAILVLIQTTDKARKANPW